MDDRAKSETHVGYVMDIACVRKAPFDELLDRAVGHTTECALMGHCVESGFALIDYDGQLHLLEPAATTQVVRELLATDICEGFRVQVRRERHGEEMRTVDIRPVAVPGPGSETRP